ncbi:MAG: hypothetical protein R2705_06345 [Ilumatobacteraceae bacterium]
MVLMVVLKQVRRTGRKDHTGIGAALWLFLHAASMSTPPWPGLADCRPPTSPGAAFGRGRRGSGARRRRRPRGRPDP